MKNKILIPSALLFILASGQAHAQLAGGDATSEMSDRDVSGGIPTAPGNPNTSTIVPDIDNIMDDPYMSTDTSEGTLNAMTPSGGGVNTNASGGTDDTWGNNSQDNAPVPLR